MEFCFTQIFVGGGLVWGGGGKQNLYYPKTVSVLLQYGGVAAQNNICLPQKHKRTRANDR